MPLEIKFAEDNNFLYDGSVKVPVPRYYREKLGIGYTEMELIANYNNQRDKEFLNEKTMLKNYLRTHKGKSEKDFWTIREKFKLKRFLWSDEFSAIMYSNFHNN